MLKSAHTGSSSSVREICSPELFMFLCGTFPKGGNKSPLQILEGQGDVLRIIFELACSEWWDAHIVPFPSDCICELLPLERNDLHELGYPYERQDAAGCPVAILQEGLTFPPPVNVPMDTFENQVSENLYVNMMPIILNKKCRKESLPPYCEQYYPLIEECARRLGPMRNPLAFLTIDERPVRRGESQRRGGVHVESPGVLPLLQQQDDSKGRSDGVYTPGAEHHWGNGMMMRKEGIIGGIFMASNVEDSCAVWNCQVHDPDGDVIGSHGDIRRLGPLLGPPTATLGAGDLVWMTDKTPHQSLPLREDSHRQYFRLVVGKVTSWFVDHSTPNPMWTSERTLKELEGINVVRGSKFRIYEGLTCHKWKVGSAEELDQACRLKSFFEILNDHGIGHLAVPMVSGGVKSVEDLSEYMKNHQQQYDGIDMPKNFWYYERLRLVELIQSL